MHKSVLFYILLLAGMAFGSRVEAQTELTRLSAEYPGEKAVYIKRKKHVFIKPAGDSLNVSAQYYNDLFLFKKEGDMYSRGSIYYSSLIDLKDVEAMTVWPEEKKSKKFKVSNFTHQDETERGIFYNDLKSVNFDYPYLEDGSHAIYSYTEVYKEPQLLGPFFFASGLATAEAEFSLTHEENVVVQYELLNVNETDLTVTQKKEGKHITKTWVMKKSPAISAERDGPNMRYYAPQIIVWVKEVKGKNNKVTYYGRNEHDLYKWCYRFLKDVNSKSEEPLKKLVDSLTAGKKTDYEKSQSIFYWVQDNIQYIAFENGYSGYIPRQAHDVCEKRYGDCKDMANLIVFMHKLAGLDARHVWIGTRDIPYSVQKYPVLFNFNHMIAACKIDGKYYFLDATGKYHPYGMQTSMIQGKVGMICNSPDSCETAKVAVADRKSNIIADTANLYIEKDLVKGKIKRYFDGYPKINLSYSYNSRNQQQLDDYLKSFLAMGNNKCQVSDYNVKNIGSRTAPVSISYNVSIPNYSIVAGNEIFVNMNLSRDLGDEKLDPEKRKVDYESDYKYEIDEVYYLKIPAGYKVNYLPENKKSEGDEYGFSITYKQQNDKIEYHKKIYIDFLLLEKSKFSKWNAMIKELNQAYKENISFIKNNSPKLK